MFESTRDFGGAFLRAPLALQPHQVSLLHATSSTDGDAGRSSASFHQLGAVFRAELGDEIFRVQGLKDLWRSSVVVFLLLRGGVAASLIWAYGTGKRWKRWGLELQP